ncbi:hypothetical protein [Adhaeribacter pallidiroseus]|uniref:Uncharacterized protein n=1 Tax=Adhaeribacter pallidiroseus TaxID=2072847 RepID=A0A369QDU0_9BACT|nr:hypothetical protein [Adhaeribacter pallidiroseus]RDC61725.1 hypothetical protein AHMF7616_00307 [Adhaeribacter pallidiroseus]
MKQFYDPEEYFLVADLSTRKLYLVHTIYSLLFKKKRPEDLISCYLYEGQGVIASSERTLIARKYLQQAKEIMPREKQQKEMKQSTPAREYMYANL